MIQKRKPNLVCWHVPFARGDCGHNRFHISNLSFFVYSTKGFQLVAVHRSFLDFAGFQQAGSRLYLGVTQRSRRLGDDVLDRFAGDVGQAEITNVIWSSFDTEMPSTAVAVSPL